MSEPTMLARGEQAESAARNDAAQKGRAIYEGKLRALLEPEYNNRRELRSWFKLYGRSP